MELVIMAAGMGSRFGGLKQTEPIDANGNFIIDYSIFDAIRCGFNKVVIIIKRENYEVFKTTIGERIEQHIKTEYAFQENNNLPASYTLPNNRTKPLGTGHAVLCAKNNITTNFAVINADDFYGYDAFKVLSDFLKSKVSEKNYAIVGYPVINTMGSGGAVKRGVCTVKNGFLQSITESSIEPQDDGTLFAKAIDGSDNSLKTINANAIVSMNMFGFNQNFMDYLEEGFSRFLEDNKNNLSSVEYFLPTEVSNLVKQNKVNVEMLNTTAKWFGITYKKDKDEVCDMIQKLVNKGVYPKDLWNN